VAVDVILQLRQEQEHSTEQSSNDAALPETTVQITSDAAEQVSLTAMTTNSEPLRARHLLPVAPGRLSGNGE